MTERFKVVPGVALIIERDDKMLLLKRSPAATHPGYYCNIGGHVDGGETIRQAAAREAYEEVGIIIKPDQLKFLQVVHRYHENGEVIVFFFKALSFEGEPINKEPEKHSEMIWVPINNLPEPLFPTFRTYLDNPDTAYAEYGWFTKDK